MAQINRPADYLVQGTTQDGATVYYTGRAGDRFISTDRADAFVGFYDTGAAHKADVLNRTSRLHGVTFHAAPAGAEELDYDQRVRKYEAEGMTRSDAQAVVDAEDLT